MSQAAADLESGRGAVGQLKMSVKTKEIELQEIRAADEAHRENIQQLLSKAETLLAKAQLVSEQKLDVLRVRHCSRNVIHVWLVLECKFGDWKRDGTRFQHASG